MSQEISAREAALRKALTRVLMVLIETSFYYATWRGTRTLVASCGLDVKIREAVNLGYDALGVQPHLRKKVFPHD